MGGFYTSLHVHVSDGANPDAIVRAVSDAVAAPGLVAPAAADVEPDQIVLVSPLAEGTPWFTIFDEALDQDEASLDSLAARVTAELKTWAVGIIVHDSDVVMLRLHKDGALIDAYNSRPDYFGEITAKERRAVVGHAQRWEPLLAKGFKAADLRSLFKGSDEFQVGEQLVEKLAPMLGLEPRLALSSFSYLHEDPDQEQRKLLAGMTRLAFRRIPKAPGSEPPVRLEPDWRTSDADVLNESAGGERGPGEMFACHASFIVSDGRGLTDGFDVEITGSAIERGLLAPHQWLSAQIAWRGGSKFERADWAEIEKNKLFRAQFRRRALPVPKAALEKQWDPKIGMWFSLSPYGTIQGDGEGELVLRIIPKESPEGAATRTYSLSVKPAPDSPFPRKALREQRGAVAFRRVHRQRIAAASMFVRHAPSLSALLTSIAERWATFIQPDAKPASWTIISGQRGGEVSVAGPGIGKLTGWSEIGPQLGAASVTFRRGGVAQAQPNIGSQLSPRSDGFSSVPLGDGLVLFGFWHYIEELPTEVREQGSKLMQRVVDEIAESAELEQAFITQWDWAPIRNIATPYEQLVDRHASTVRPYGSSLLHAVTELMWIGPRLAARIDFDRVREFADVRAAGAATFILLREDRGLEELERALANALPGPERFEASDLAGPPGWSSPSSKSRDSK